MKKRLTVTLLMLLICAVFFSTLTGCEKKNSELDELFGIPDEAEEVEIDINTSTYLTIFFMGEPKPDTAAVYKEIEKRTADILKVKFNFCWYDTYGYGGYESLSRSTYMYQVRHEMSEQRTKQEELSPLGKSFAINYTLDAFECFGNEPMSGSVIATLARAGKLRDITELLPQYAPNLYMMLTEEDIKAASIDGRLYVAPSLYPVEHGVCAIVREDLKNKYGIPDIKTLEDYELYLKTIKENEDSIIPGKICGTLMEIFPHCYGYAVLDHECYMVYDPEDPEMRIIPLENASGFEEFINMLLRWYNDDLLDTQYGLEKGITDFRHPVPFSRLTGGEISSFLMAETRMDGKMDTMLEEFNHILRNNLKDKNARLKAYILYPERQRWKVSPHGTRYAGGCMAFNEFSPNVETALRFIDWVYATQENYDLFMYGIKGEHYEVDGDDFRLPSNSTYSENRYIGWPGSKAIRSFVFERFFTTNPDEDKENYINRLRKAVYAPHEGFFAETNQISNEVWQRDIAMSNFERSLLTGQFKAEALRGFIESLRIAGSDTIVDELQMQLDAWRVYYN